MKRIYLLYFLAGFLTNGVIWRIDQGQYDVIGYPVALLVIVSLIIWINRRV